MMKEFQATFVGSNRVAVGSKIECEYNGKARIGTVDKLFGVGNSVTQLSVETQDGFRRFNISGLSKLKVS